MSAPLPVLAGLLLSLATGSHASSLPQAFATERTGAAATVLKVATMTPPDFYLVGDLRVTHASIQGVTDQGVGASAYLAIEDRGPAPDRLLAAIIAGADHVSIEGDTAGDGLVIAAGETLTMTADGPHLVLEGVHAAFRPGDRIEGTLQFERAGALPIHFIVGDSDDRDGPKP